MKRKKGYSKCSILENKKKKKCNLITLYLVPSKKIPMMNKCRQKTIYLTKT